MTACSCSATDHNFSGFVHKRLVRQQAIVTDPGSDSYTVSCQAETGPVASACFIDRRVKIPPVTVKHRMTH